MDVAWHLRTRVWRPLANPIRRARNRRRARNFYRAFIAPGDLVFDVGANFGVWTRLLLDVGARVIAIEPQPGIFTEPRAVLEPVAVGRSSGECELRVKRDPGISGLSTLSAEWPDLLTESGRVYEGAWAGTIPVRVTTLDELIDKHGVPTYIKIDTEGWDAEALAGLSHAVAHVSFEFVPEAAHVAEAAIGELARLGDYRLSFLPEEGWRPCPWPPTTPVWGDVFAELVTAH
jgi:FkbM family methyltransferase